MKARQNALKCEITYITDINTTTMKTITINDKKYIVRKSKKRDGCEMCTLTDKCSELKLRCLSLIGSNGYFVEDTFINRLKTLLGL